MERTMRKFFLATLVIWVMILSLVCHSEAAPSVGKLVLRLPYRGEESIEKIVAHPFNQAFYWDKGYRHSTLLGTDQQGSIYLSDAVTAYSCVVERFDKQGKVLDIWQPLDARYPLASVTTRRGNVWVGTEESDGSNRGLPLVMYHIGKKQPVFDWRVKTPSSIMEQIADAAKKQGLNISSDTGWGTIRLTTDGQRVLVWLSGGGLGSVKHISRTLCLLLSGDGKQVLDVKIVPQNPLLLTPGGQQRSISTDFQVDTFSWNKLWISQGPIQKTILIDKAHKLTPFASVLQLGNGRLVSPYIDARGNIYLPWAREDTKHYTRRIVVGQDVHDLDAPMMEGERALVVLNAKHQVATYLPWMPNTFEYGDTWIKPLPDGSGFYRIEFAEKEARIYFHPLPN